MEVTADFPVGSYVKNSTDGTWHLITAVTFSDPDTDVTVVASVTQWDGLTVRAYTAPRIINCQLTGTLESIDTDAETPAIISGLVSDQDYDDTNIINMANTYFGNLAVKGNTGFYGKTPIIQPTTIIDADGQLADITTKFNTLLAKLEALGLLADA